LAQAPHGSLFKHVSLSVSLNLLHLAGENEHSRVRVLFPSPQVALHDDQAPQTRFIFFLHGTPLLQIWISRDFPGQPFPAEHERSRPRYPPLHDLEQFDHEDQLFHCGVPPAQAPLEHLWTWTESPVQAVPLHFLRRICCPTPHDRVHDPHTPHWSHWLDCAQGWVLQKPTCRWEPLHDWLALVRLHDLYRFLEPPPQLTGQLDQAFHGAHNASALVVVNTGIGGGVGIPLLMPPRLKIIFIIELEVEEREEKEGFFWLKPRKMTASSSS
jgi:hypothetical protein